MWTLRGSLFRCEDYACVEVNACSVHAQVACRSVGKTAVFQMQDVMALDNEARMNTPGKAVGNWAWRMGDASVWTTLKASAARLYSMNKLYDRYGCRGGTGCC